MVITWFEKVEQGQVDDNEDKTPSVDCVEAWEREESTHSSWSSSRVESPSS
jgi:hypothetical protein